MVRGEIQNYRQSDPILLKDADDETMQHFMWSDAIAEMRNHMPMLYAVLAGVLSRGNTDEKSALKLVIIHG